MVIGSDLDDGDDDDASGRPIKASVLCLKATFIQGLLTMAFSLILTFLVSKQRRGVRNFDCLRSYEAYVQCFCDVVT